MVPPVTVAEAVTAEPFPCVVPVPEVTLCEDVADQALVVTDLTALDIQQFPWFTHASLPSGDRAVSHGEHTGLTRGGTSLSPLETILAGRTAAGCHELSTLLEVDVDKSGTSAQSEFLSFRVSNEIYGINIMDIKEIITLRTVTEVPRSPEFVAGILSLRGTIIPVIDMRSRLSLSKAESNGRERIIVIRNNTALSGLLVDEVMKVILLSADSIEATPGSIDGTDRDFIAGLGHYDGKLLVILNLATVVDIDVV